MEERLRPINALLGLLLPADVSSPALADAGFQLAGLEVPAAGSGGSVTVDAVLVHAETSHLMVVEAKAGANVEERQARAYSGLKAADVVQSAYVTLTARSSPTIEVVYLCLSEHLDRIRLGLEQVGLSMPIIAVSGDAVRLELADIAGPQLRSAFIDGQVDLHGAVPRLIPFDQDSDPEIIRPRVLAALVAAMAQRLDQLSLPSLAERATPHYALYGRQAQQRIRRKVADAASRLAADDPMSFQVVPNNNKRDGLVRILRTPEDNDARGRTQAYQAVGRPTASRKKRRKPEIPGQLDLLSMLETSDNDGTEEPVAGQEGER